MHISRRPGRPPVLNSPRTSAQTGSIESRGLWEARHSFYATSDLPYFIIIYLDSAEKIARKVGGTARCHSWVICSFKSNLLSETGSLTLFFSETWPRMPWRWSALAFSRCVSTTSTKVCRKPGRTDWTKACGTKIVWGVSHYFLFWFEQERRLFARGTEWCASEPPVKSRSNTLTNRGLRMNAPTLKYQ